jgi:hypothetical protein
MAATVGGLEPRKRPSWDYLTPEDRGWIQMQNAKLKMQN